MSLDSSQSVPTSRNGPVHPFRHFNQTPAGTAGEEVVIFQELCPEDPEHRIIGPRSEPEPIATAPSPLPHLNFFEAYAGTGRVRIGGAYTGERELWNHAGYSTRTWGFAPYDHNITFSNLFIDENEPFEVSRRLCDVTPTIEEFEPIPLEETEQLVPTPSISGPVCENATFVDVSTSFPGGRFVIYDGPTPVTQASANAGSARIGIPPIKNKVISVRQMLYSGFLGPMASTLVDEGIRLEVVNGGTYVDQNDSSIIYSPAVLREGQGVRIRLSECCADYDDLPPSITAVVGEQEVNLYRTHDGNYEGIWDFRTENATVPAINESYEAAVEAPCSGEELVLEFFVVTGEIDINDTTDPRADIRASQPGRTPSAMLDSFDSAGSNYLVEPGVPISIDFGAYDASGVQRISATHSGSGALSGGLREAQLVAPLPTNFDDHASISPIDPYQVASVFSSARDFAGNTSATPSLTLTGEHMKPSISSVSPDPVQNNGSATITIDGEHLAASTLETRVTFDAVDAPIVETVTLSSGLSSQQLSGVAIPSVFENYFGDLDVTVITKHLNGPQEESSDAERMELELARSPESVSERFVLAKFSNSSDGTKFSGSPNRSCSSNEPGAVNGITITSGGWSVQSNNLLDGSSRGNELVDFQIDTSQNGPFGGAAISANCRTVVALSFDNNSGTEKTYTFTAYYFGPSGPVLIESESSIGATWQQPVATGQPTYQDAPAEWVVQVLINEDGTVVFLQNSASNKTAINSQIPIYGHIFDLWKDERVSTGNAAECSGGNCPPSASINSDPKAVMNVGADTIELDL